MAVIDRPVILPKLVFVTAWHMLGLGDPPPALGTNLHHWTTDAARAELEARTMATLGGLGLARNNRIGALWRTTVTVAARASREYYAFTNFPDGRACSILVATREGDAIRAIVADDVVSVEPIEDKWHATALWETLPEVPAATRPANLAEAMRRPRTALHQIYTARRTGNGNRARSTPITVVDWQTTGRALVYRTTTGTITVAPGTAREFIRTLNSTHAIL